ncbi:MAG: hypothetical protein ACJ8F3_20905 [Xanthobacteraceae bacterium]
MVKVANAMICAVAAALIGAAAARAEPHDGAGGRRVLVAPRAVGPGLVEPRVVVAPRVVGRPFVGRTVFVRPYVPYRRRPWFGTVVAGVALGTIVGVAVVGAAPAAPPGPGLCWYWADPSLTRGFWDYCTAPY